jgi:inward rectifier potassium channel
MTASNFRKQKLKNHHKKRGFMQQTIDPGLGEKYFGKTKRVINKDGSFNVTRSGTDFHPKDIYQFLVNLSWTKFFGLIAISYLLFNALFGLIYFLTGIQNLRGLVNSTSLVNYLNCFFFSVQTSTTIGYGGVLPEGLSANFIVTIEAMTGVLAFALITGLLYGRFSHPFSRILYSENAVIAPYKEIRSLQFRIANQRNNNIMELEARLLAVLVDKDFNRKYYDMKLERYSVYFFPLSWTIVHPIDEDSPIFEKSLEELKEKQFEILILIKGYDDTFNQIVHSRYSYTFDEIIWGAKFVRSFNTNSRGDIILKLEDIHLFEKINLE